MNPRTTVHAVKVVGVEPGKMLAACVPWVEGSFKESARLRIEKGRVGHDRVRHELGVSIPDAK